jgi:hypothetical protein
MFGLIAFVALGAIVPPVHGAATDPKQAVLRQSDVPAGFDLDMKASRYWSNKQFARGRPTVRKLIVESGRISGYQAVYTERAVRLRMVQSGADLYRGPGGPRAVLSWMDRTQTENNARRVKRGDRPSGRQPARVGEESWMYWDGAPAFYVHVVWRQGRVLGSVNSWGIGRQQTLALAKVQQHRIATAVR